MNYAFKIISILNLGFMLTLFISCTSIPPRVDDPAVPIQEDFSTNKTKNQKIIHIKELKIIDTKDRKEEAKKNFFEKKDQLYKKTQELELLISNEATKKDPKKSNEVKTLEKKILLLQAQVKTYEIEIKLRDAQMAMLIANLELEKAGQIISQSKLIKNSNNQKDNQKLARAVDNLKKYVNYHKDRKNDYESLLKEFHENENIVTKLKGQKQ